MRRRWRHEQQSVAVALAAALHHSSGLSTKNVVERREGPEGEVCEKHVAPRGQKAPLPGTRLLPVVAESLVRLEAAARVSAGAPSLAPVVLSSADDGVDASTLNFLRQNLEMQRKKDEEEKRSGKEEEAKERKLKQEEAEHERRMQVLNRRVRDDIPLSPTEYEAGRRWSGLPPLQAAPASSSSSGRKRRKRRTRRTCTSASTSSVSRRTQWRSVCCSASFVLLVNVRLYVNACYAVFLCSTFWSVCTRRTVLQWDVAALVVVMAVACLLLVCW